MFRKQSRKLVHEDQNQTESDELHKLKEICCVITRIDKHGIHEPSRHEQDRSVHAKEVGNVSKRLNFLDASIQNKCIDMENTFDFVDASRHPSWALGRITCRMRKCTRKQNSRTLRVCSKLLKSW